MLLDANVIAGYYLPQATTPRIHQRMHELCKAMRTVGRAEKPFVLFVPNFCVAEVFNVFRKYRFGKWNPKVKKTGGAISKEKYEKIYSQFQRDIHKGRLFYHYELSRYHLLNTALISPIDQHYAYERQRGREKPNPSPMSTLDLLIVGIGIELVRLHGNDSVFMLTDDDRIWQIVKRAGAMRENTVKRLGLNSASNLVGRRFSPKLFPKVVHLRKTSQAEFKELFA